MFDLQGKGVSHHIQCVSIQDGVSGTFFQDQIEQVDGSSPLLERQSQDDAPFPTSVSCMHAVLSISVKMACYMPLFDRSEIPKGQINVKYSFPVELQTLVTVVGL